MLRKQLLRRACQRASVPGPPAEEKPLREAFSYGYPQVGH